MRRLKIEAQQLRARSTRFVCVQASALGAKINARARKWLLHTHTCVHAVRDAEYAPAHREAINGIYLVRATYICI